MAKYTCLRPVSDGKTKNGEPHPVGTVIELGEAEAQQLVDDGALEPVAEMNKKATRPAQ